MLRLLAIDLRKIFDSYHYWNIIGILLLKQVWQSLKEHQQDSLA